MPVSQKTICGSSPAMTNIYMSSLQSFESDDPALAEEYELLLSQFMKSSSSKNQEAWPSNNLKKALHTSTSIASAHETAHNSKSRADNYRELGYMIPNSCTFERPTEPQIQQSETTRSIPPSSVHPFERCVQSPSHADSGLRSQNAKSCNRDTTSSSASICKRSMLGRSHRNKSTRSSPTTSFERESLSPSSSNTRSPAPRARRSARSKKGPKNYYEIPPLFESDSEQGYRNYKVTTSSTPASKNDALACPPYACDQDTSHQRSGLPAHPVHRVSRVFPAVNSLLFNRELGGAVKRQLRTTIAHDFGLFKTWKGASNDVVVLAWSPDGTRFAAGATAQCDERHMAYNRSNNLLVGDLTCNRLEEVPDHHIKRSSVASATSQRNLSDNRLFMSVTAMQWFEDTLFTASYDKTVKLWNFTDNGVKRRRNLKHDSEVRVMARSNFNRNVLATGTDSFGLWNIRESQYSPLEIESRKDLIPTCLAWGTTGETKNILLAGMSGRSREDEVVENGLLAAWHVGEASVTKRQFQPNSQNIFDIKWHPTLPRFATASTVGQSLVSRNTQSVVRVFEPLTWKSPMIEFECPALDINDITFCPYNLHYVTASCTDGATYVWDFRKHDKVLLELRHGEPLHQLDMDRPREQQDIGVGMALWGNECNEFYTGASDGIAKQWDILRSQTDAPTRTVFEPNEEITCGAFSSDRSHLLVGDAGGGIHVLSPNMSCNEDEDGVEHDRNMDFKHASWPPCDDLELDPESGVASAQELLNSGRLKRHPKYGVGQGPLYDGPFASWARPPGVHPSLLRCTDLDPVVKAVQLDGLPPKHRIGLDEIAQRTIEAHRKMAKIRNGQPNEHKRKLDVIFVDLCSDKDENESSRRSSSGWKRRSTGVQRFKGSFIDIPNLDCEVIDLTGDTDADSEDGMTTGNPESSESFPELRSLLEILREGVEDDFWWPASNKIDPNFPQENA